MDQWEGQNWKRSPGNLYGEPTKSRSIRASPTPIKLVADKVIPPIEVPADTALVKRIKIQSQILTKWWGHPIFLGATVLLPKDYDAHPDAHYPVNYERRTFLARRAGRLRPRRPVRQAVARGRHAALHLRHAPASVALLRRFVRRELREQRPVRRRDHAGADPGGRNEVPRDPGAVGADALGRIDRRLDCPRPSDLLPGFLRRHVRELPGLRRLHVSPDRQHLQRPERLLSSTWAGCSSIVPASAVPTATSSR